MAISYLPRRIIQIFQQILPKAKGWGNIFRRRVRVFTMALVIYLDYKVLQQREKWASNPNTLWEKAHERNAKRVLSLIVELGGLWVKLGQYMSTRADVLPDAYISRLKMLQDSLPPRPLQEVCRTIETELGQSMDDLFLDFVKIPLATASIAQVHRATLLNGQEVVVKVQHEGIKKIILEDLKNAKKIVDWIAWAEPQNDFNPLIDEWCKEAPKEVDFIHEAENTRTVSRNLRCKNIEHDDKTNANQVDVLIPDVIQSSEKVLILEYMDGIRLNDLESLEAFGVNKQKLVEEITRAYAHQIYVDGYFNGDPHPGNFLASKEPPHRPILLDFGLTKKLSIPIKQALAKMFLASAEGDHAALLSAFAEMGFKLRLDMPEQAMEITSVLFRTSSSAKESLETMKLLSEKRAKNMKVIQEKMKLNQKEFKRFNPVDAIPGDIVIFSRVLGLLRGLSSTLNVRIVYLDIMRPFAESALQGKLKLEENVANIWPEFGSNRKDLIKVHHVLNHTSGLHNAFADITREDPLQLSDWDECLNHIALSVPETEPGQEQLYHHLSFGWLCGGIIEHASGKKFKEILEEAFIHPLQIEGELYIGIPPGVESRLATLTIDKDDLQKLLGISSRLATRTLDKDDHEKLLRVISRFDVPSTIQPSDVSQVASTLPVIFNSLNVRRAIIPAANGHCSARALARYYAALADGGMVPWPHSSSSKPPLGSHPHIPKFPSQKTSKRQKGSKTKEVFAAAISRTNDYGKKPNYSDVSHSRNSSDDSCTRLVNESSNSNSISMTDSSEDSNPRNNSVGRIFSNPRIHDAFLGVGEYGNLALANGKFGLGFRRSISKDGSIVGFGHSGLGGSTGFADMNNRFAIAVTVNKMSFGAVTGNIINFVCSELNIPVPEEFSIFSEMGPNAQICLGRLLND
ncbi:hypothetical protein RGQ29_021679 [Quercus rubra]|uniref:ABC1 family protein n=1 Tax=Quercus rubra TaxID=3512 RepID=A0AAN7FEB8_QUERU|nr:hypothetical protein RGQ29_021679 [Quercus rubra]